jgi:serine protease Do
MALVMAFFTANLLTGCQPRVIAAPPPAPPPAPAAEPAPPAPIGTYVAPMQNPVASTAPASDIAGLVERLKPTVVNITTSHITRVSDPHEGFGGMFRMGPGSERRSKSLGSGFIVDPSGLVVTNAHVIAGADDIQVRLSDDRELPARLVGKDTKLDLALLRIEGAAGLAAAPLGDSDGLRVGEWVIAIGNPFGLGHTVTLGITSAKDRTIGAGPYDAFIQTDASINPGNSGGPLFNLKGEIVGIPTAIRQGAQGIGFAVPVNALKDVLPQLRDKGVVSRGKLGVRTQHLSQDLAQSFGLARARGALVSNIEPGSAAAKAGLSQGDVITQIENDDVVHSEDLPRLVARHAPGSKVKVRLVRGGKPLALDAVLDVLADEPDDDEEPGSKPSPKNPAQEPASRLGIQIDDAPSGAGARVRVVSPISIAAGQLLPGDVIVEVNRKPVKSSAEAMKLTENIAAGQVLLLKVRRGTDFRFVALKIK